MQFSYFDFQFHCRQFTRRSIKGTLSREKIAKNSPATWFNHSFPNVWQSATLRYSTAQRSRNPIVIVLLLVLALDCPIPMTRTRTTTRTRDSRGLRRFGQIPIEYNSVYDGALNGYSQRMGERESSSCPTVPAVRCPRPQMESRKSSNCWRCVGLRRRKRSRGAVASPSWA